MRLTQLLAPFIDVDPVNDCEVKGLSQDSRTLQPGELFLAYPGTQVDGRAFIQTAIRKGACAILSEAPFQGQMHDIPLFTVKRLQEKVGFIAAHFYGHPSRDMTVIGITGTNGKTSCTHFLAHCLTHLGRRCAVIGSLGNGYYDPFLKEPLVVHASRLTTPNPIEIQCLLAQFRNDQIQWVVMEVSSHSLSQGRVNGVQFTLGAFTNLSWDHLDYHHTMEEYAQEKYKLFKHPNLKYAVFNLDDPYGARGYYTASLTLKANAYAFTLKKPPSDTSNHQIVGQAIPSVYQGIAAHIQTPWGEGRLTHSNLLGHFNLSNLMLVTTVLGILGDSLSDIFMSIKTIRSVTGRMECLGGYDQNPHVVIDYAHTPHALQSALQALKIKQLQGRLWCVFGCGGDRDPKKRPMMGKIAETYAHKVILTEDNPRFESSEKIFLDILSGFTEPDKVVLKPKREEAINYAIHHATFQDTILIAGKGHEQDQIIQGIRYPFSDHAVVEKILSMR